MLTLILGCIAVGEVSAPQAWADASGNGWSYNSNTKTLTINGSLTELPSLPNSLWASVADEVEHIVIQAGSSARYGSYLFRGMSSLIDVEGMGNLTVENTDVGFMFANCTSLKNLDLTGFDTSNVTNFGDMFQNCSQLETLNVSTLDTRSALDMSGMFDGCTSLKTLDCSNFRTPLLGTNENFSAGLLQMFRNCSALEHLDISHLDTSHATNMAGMFDNCLKLKSLNLSNFNTSNVTNMADMFFHCEALETLNVSSFNTENVKSMRRLFAYCKSLTSLDISSFDMSSVTNASMMFHLVNASTIKLGSKFAFKPENYNTSETYPVFMSPPTTDGYNGKWTSNTADPSGNPQYTAQELRDAYTASMAGTYVWAREASVPETYTITYNTGSLAHFADGTTTKTQTKNAGTSLTLLSDKPVQDGASTSTPYTINANGGKFSDNTETANGTIRETTSYTFNKWHGSDGTDYTSGGSYTKDANVTLTPTFTTSNSTNVSALPNVSRQGYSFKGYYTAATGGTRIGDVGAKPTAAQARAGVYAQWSQNTHTVTFKDKDGATIGTPQTVAEGGSATAPEAPVVEGWTFTGWDRNFTNVTSDIVVNAKYTQNAITITYHAGEIGGQFENGEKTRVQMKAAGEPIEISDVIPVGTAKGAATPVQLETCGGTLEEGQSNFIRQSYVVNNTFVGWNTKEDGSGENYKIGQKYEGDEALDLWAQYSTENINDSEKLPAVTRTGYTFDGWYTAETDGNKVGDAGDQIPFSSEFWGGILYAHWAKIPEAAQPAVQPTVQPQPVIISTGDDFPIVIVALTGVIAIVLSVGIRIKRKR